MNSSPRGHRGDRAAAARTRCWTFLCSVFKERSRRRAHWS